jgi:membrane protease YdiL (CAAX protease family)
MIKTYLDELKQFDLETILIIAYSTFILLFTVYFREYRFIIPGEQFLSKLIASGTLYAVAPFVLFFIFKHKPKDFGISLGRVNVWWKEVLFFYVIMLIVLLISFYFTRLKVVYPLYRKAHAGFHYFMLYQSIQCFHMFAWEFFFRGFMLFGLEKKFGKASILVQMIPFAIMHFRKPHLEAYGSIIAGIILGIVAYRSRSFLPAAILHFSVALTADIIGILL